MRLFCCLLPPDLSYCARIYAGVVPSESTWECGGGRGEVSCISDDVPSSISMPLIPYMMYGSDRQHVRNRFAKLNCEYSLCSAPTVAVLMSLPISCFHIIYNLC
jgi:hypothetical protein